MSKTVKIILKVVRILAELIMTCLAFAGLFGYVGAVGYEAKAKGFPAYTLWHEKANTMSKEEKKESKRIMKELKEAVIDKIMTGIEWIEW